MTQQISDLDKLINKDILKKLSDEKQKYLNNNSNDKQNNNALNFSGLLEKNISNNINDKNKRDEDNTKEFNNFDEILIKNNTYKYKNIINNNTESLSILHAKKISINPLII